MRRRLPLGAAGSQAAVLLSRGCLDDSVPRWAMGRFRFLLAGAYAPTLRQEQDQSFEDLAKRLVATHARWALITRERSWPGLVRLFCLGRSVDREEGAFRHDRTFQLSLVTAWVNVKQVVARSLELTDSLG